VSLTISSLSLEYIRVKITAFKIGAPINPTGDTVQFAFTAVDVNPVSWVSGSWETVTDAGGNNTYFALCLVGPGGTANLTSGTYSIWVKVADNPETPVMNVGNLLVA
jgi:hypothetical protein